MDGNEEHGRRRHDHDDSCDLKYTKLEITMVKMAEKISSLAESDTRTNKTVEALSESLSLLAKNQTIIDNHSEKIEVLFKKVENLENRERIVENALNIRCDTHKTSLEDKIDAVDTKIDEKEGQLDNRGIKRLSAALAILVFAFGYLYLDTAELRTNTREDNKEIIGKLDKITDKLGEVGNTVLENRLGHEHNKDLINSFHDKHKHKSKD